MRKLENREKKSKKNDIRKNVIFVGLLKLIIS
jgi:hypothetical protein